MQLIAGAVIEVSQRDISSISPEARLHLITFDFYHRLTLPVIIIEYPSGKHLLGRESFVTAFAVNFHAEIAGHGLQGHHPVAPIDIDTAKIFSQRTLQHTWHGGGFATSGMCHTSGATDQHHHSNRLQKAPETRMLRKEKCQHRHKHSTITAITYPYSPRIMTH